MNNELLRMSSVCKAKIGLYTVMLKAYWDQFDDLKSRLMSYGAFIEKRMGRGVQFWACGR